MAKVTPRSRTKGTCNQKFNGRYAAAETLVRLQETKLPVKPLFDSVTQEHLITGTERGLAMNLVYGVLRHREYLNHLLSQLSTRPVQQLDAFVHMTLLVGLYQLYCLDRIPESAAVNEAVNSVKSAGLPAHLHGFVNGVLRNATRKRNQLPGPRDGYGDGRPFLNHPGWLTRRWAKRYGQQEMERICAANNRESQLILRINSRAISRQEYLAQLEELGIDGAPGRYAPDSLVLKNFQGAITSLPGYEAGHFQIQDEAAQLATLLLGPFRPGGRYLDCCAGLGGKTGHIYQLAGDEAEVIAVEPEPQRQKLFYENMQRLFPGKNIVLHSQTLADFTSNTKALFDGVLIDAPCSGTGVIGRNPDIRWNRKKSDLMKYQQTQSELIEQASHLIAEDGILVYATCSLEPEENRQVVDRFLAEHPQFFLCDCRDYLPAQAQEHIEDKCFCPHPSAAIDGFFAARLQHRSQC